MYHAMLSKYEFVAKIAAPVAAIKQVPIKRGFRGTMEDIIVLITTIIRRYEAKDAAATYGLIGTLLSCNI